MRSVHASLLEEAKRDLIETGKWIDGRGWCPATGGNFSIRLPDQKQQESVCLVTASGSHKGRLSHENFILTDLRGQPLDSQATNRPSAETLVHVALYRLSDKINAVLHIHSIPNTVLSILEPQDTLTIKGLEMQKSVTGITSHKESLHLSVFDNTQDMSQLAKQIESRWQSQDDLRGGVLVRGHGAYFWGQDLAEAVRHLEGIEFMLSCLLELKRLQHPLPFHT